MLTEAPAPLGSLTVAALLAYTSAVELLPCTCVLVPLILVAAWLAYAPLFRRQTNETKTPPEDVQ